VKVYVVYAHAGLNGAWIEGVFSTQAAAEAVAAEANRRHHSIGGASIAVATVDGAVEEIDEAVK